MDIVTLVVGLIAGAAVGAAAALSAARARVEAGHEASVRLEAELERARSERDAELRLAEARLAHEEEKNQRLDERLRALSNDALKSNSEDFLRLANQTFAPISDRLDRFDRQLQDFRQSHGSISTGLASVARETSNLSNALRKPHVRGRWGEISLRNAVEAAGLTAHCDFVEQAPVTGDDGPRRPDLVVNLPGDRRVVVDAKVPLQAYLEAVEATDDDEREARLREHAAQVRKQIQELSKKGYWEQFDRAPECVVMFLSIEPTLAAALDHHPSLFEEAAGHRVILATPSTLVGMLFAMAQAWKQEAAAENAERISQLGRELYARLVKVGDHFGKLGRGIDSVVRSYNETVGSLESRVLVTARKFEDLELVSGDMEGLARLDASPRPLTADEFGPSPERVVPLERRVAIDDDAYGTLSQRALTDGDDDAEPGERAVGDG